MRRLAAAAVAALFVMCPVPRALGASGLDVNSLGLAANYDVEATFDWHGRTADVKTTATVRGSMPWPTTTLAFNLQILRIGHAKLTTTTVGGMSVAATVDDQTVLVPLEPPLAPGSSVVVELDYTARMTATPNPNGDNWGFAATRDYLTGYRWIPWLSRTTRFNRPSVGDPYVTATAGDVHVEISADPSLVFSSTGVETPAGNGRHVFEAHNVRDFNFSASPTYRIATRTVRGVKVTLAYDHLDPGLILATTARAINAFSNRIGAYPYPVLNIAESGPWASIESPEHFWLADNVPRHLLAWTTAHEVAHEWFYAAVGNDQAREPFADEALADYISRDLISRFVPSQCPPGRLDSTIYDLGDCYPWVVYVQGDAYLRDYRARIGSAAFWSRLREYYRAYRDKMGGTRELLSALGAQGWSETRRRFPSLFVIPVICLPMGAAAAV